MAGAVKKKDLRFFSHQKSIMMSRFLFEDLQVLGENNVNV